MSAVPLQRTQAEPDVAAMMRDVGQRARVAAREIARASTAIKNAALETFAGIIEAESAAILAANAEDVRAARAAGLEDALVERLELNPARVKTMADGVREVAALPDPIGEMFDLKVRPHARAARRRRHHL